MASPSVPVPGHADPARERLARHAAPFLWLEAGRRMAERLSLLRAQPEQVVDLGCAWGDGLALLRQHYPDARIIGVEAASALAERTRRRHAARGMLQRLRRAAPTEVLTHAPDAVPAPESGLVPGQAGLLWANLTLPWSADPQTAFGAWHRLLRLEGVLMFTTFGPDTLRELRAPEVQALGVRAREWPDMHDLGDLLVHQGFADPVMDMELVRLRYPSAQAALEELAQLGRPSHQGAYPGLRTPRAWRALGEALERLAHRSGLDGGVELSFELVYGHAFKPATSRAEAGVATFSVDQLRASRRAR